MVRLNEEQIAWVRDTYQQHSLMETTALFNDRYGTGYQAASLKACFPFYKIKSGRYQWMNRDHVRAWLPEHIEWLRIARQDYQLLELTARYNAHFGHNRTPDQIASACCRYRILSPRTGSFRPGNQPWNKGMKGLNLGGGAGRFKKGARSLHANPIGTRIQKDGLWRVKIAESPGPGLARYGWIDCHRQVWEAAHGPLPKGHAIVFIDGDHDNLSLDNLERVTRSELMFLNKLGWRQLADLDARRAMIIQCRLLSRAHQRARDLGLDLSARRRLLPTSHRVLTAPETAPCS